MRARHPNPFNDESDSRQKLESSAVGVVQPFHIPVDNLAIESSLLRTSKRNRHDAQPAKVHGEAYTCTLGHDPDAASSRENKKHAGLNYGNVW